MVCQWKAIVSLLWWIFQNTIGFNGSDINQSHWALLYAHIGSDSEWALRKYWESDGFVLGLSFANRFNVSHWSLDYRTYYASIELYLNVVLPLFSIGLIKRSVVVIQILWSVEHRCVYLIIRATFTDTLSQMAFSAHFQLNRIRLECKSSQARLVWLANCLRVSQCEQ